MGFSLASSNTNNSSGKEFKKADYFVNFKFADEAGKTHNVGALALHNDNPLHAFIIGICNASPTGLQTILAQMDIDFKSAVPALQGAKFALKVAA